MNVVPQMSVFETFSKLQLLQNLKTYNFFQWQNWTN